MWLPVATKHAVLPITACTPSAAAEAHLGRDAREDVALVDVVLPRQALKRRNLLVAVRIEVERNV